MGAKYDVLKIATISGTVFSVYNAFTETLLLEDLILAILIAITFVAVANEMKESEKTRQSHDLGKAVAEQAEREISTT